MGLRTVAKALIIQDGALLTIKKYREGQSYYVLPGGGQHLGENLCDTVRRECSEELGVRVDVGDLLFVHEYIASEHPGEVSNPEFHAITFVFTCDALTDEFRPPEPDECQIGIEWIPIQRLGERVFYPPGLPAMINREQKVYLGDIG